MRLNVGCGAHYADGWVNVDNNPAVYAEFHADAVELPFPDGSAEMVYLGHLLDHAGPVWAGMVLTEARRILQPAGFLVVLYPATSLDDAERNVYLWDLLNSGFEQHWQDEYLAEQARRAGRYTYRLVSDVFPESVNELAHQLAPEWPVGLQPPWACAVLASKPRSGETHRDGDVRSRQRPASTAPAHRARRQRQPASEPVRRHGAGGG